MIKKLEVKVDKLMLMIEELEEAITLIDVKIDDIQDKANHRDSGDLTEKEEERIEALEELRYSIEEAKEYLEQAKEKIDEAIESLQD